MWLCSYEVVSTSTSTKRTFGSLRWAWAQAASTRTGLLLILVLLLLDGSLAALAGLAWLELRTSIDLDRPAGDTSG